MLHLLRILVIAFHLCKDNSSSCSGSQIIVNASLSRVLNRNEYLNKNKITKFNRILVHPTTSFNDEGTDFSSESPGSHFITLYFSTFGFYYFSAAAPSAIADNILKWISPRRGILTAFIIPVTSIFAILASK